ncbi:hypothetical protein BABINDRAFT_8167 [Babjeviella inositovora NRRL Y-12698]|uniref:SPIN90/Ldb17 leucine-rich domain-containing protein n=1 Tax=Babjeviella inositovora NRRL Y-12698 TaxID=984486 RepID=A0A1E3QR71_9ASCO|nr:uncharacterized protein BABINDRAFT_8167 [Babjeviella inositovora NRRL Y-12698]ODQ79984.1 hypothetical protein BABINDRAFT_8167 [Babjeviella inositovora NRRL Y-12698]
MDDTEISQLSCEDFHTLITNILEDPRCHDSTCPDDGEILNSHLIIYFKVIVCNLHSPHIFPETQSRDRKTLEKIVMRYSVRLINSPFFVLNNAFILSKILSMLGVPSLDVHLKCFLICVLKALLQREDKYLANQASHDTRGVLMTYLDDLGFKRILFQAILDSRTDAKVLHFLQDLLLAVIRLEAFLLEDLTLINNAYLERLIDFKEFNLKQSLYNEEVNEQNELFEDEYLYEWDDVNYIVFRILLVLNEQFVIKFYQLEKAEKPHFINSVFKFVISHSQNNFPELLIYYFNREQSHFIKILILKFLYLMFTTSFTVDYFYINDLKILIDIFIRELLDLSTEQEPLINIYLKVLYPMLTYSALPHLCYKTDDIRVLLENLAYNFESDATKRLAVNCMNVAWLKDGGSDDELDEDISQNLQAVNLNSHRLLSPENEHSTESLNFPLARSATSFMDTQSIESTSLGSSSLGDFRAPPPPVKLRSSSAVRAAPYRRKPPPPPPPIYSGGKASLFRLDKPLPRPPPPAPRKNHLCLN